VLTAAIADAILTKREYGETVRGRHISGFILQRLIIIWDNIFLIITLSGVYW